MIQQIDSIRKTRAYVLEVIRGLSTEQLNLVPNGFNNNMIWNVGHLIAAQQAVCYARPGIPLVIEDALFHAYKPGSKPLHFTEPEEIEVIKELLFSTLDELERDLSQHLFVAYQPWTTRYGVTLRNIEDAIQFLLYHEGLHTGVLTSMRKIVVG